MSQDQCRVRNNNQGSEHQISRQLSVERRGRTGRAAVPSSNGTVPRSEAEPYLMIKGCSCGPETKLHHRGKDAQASFFHKSKSPLHSLLYYMVQSEPDHGKATSTV